MRIKEYKPIPEIWDYRDIYIYWRKENVYFEELTDDQRVNLIHSVEFKIWIETDGLAVQDMDGANLGDIESERFIDTIEICQRIEHYFDDYINEY